MLPEKKAFQAGLPHYLLNNLDYHYQKQNYGMQTIDNMGCRENDFQFTVVFKRLHSPACVIVLKRICDFKA